MPPVQARGRPWTPAFAGVTAKTLSIWVGFSISPLIDLDDLGQHVQRLLLRSLEGIAANDRAIAAAVADCSHFGEDAVEVLRLAAREDDDATAVEGGLHDVADARGRGRDVDILLLVDRLCRRQLEMRGRRLDLDDMRAELGGDLCGIGADVDRGLALTRQVAAARVGQITTARPYDLASQAISAMSRIWS